jgi:hypothetical protein
MQYTEEHYAELYNNLPEGLKDLVLSGRLAILVSAIGSRHGLNADQIADLEPAIEDVCLGLITTDELVDNILKNVKVDQRVANRIAAEAELEILKPFTSELVIARKQKEDLDARINKASPAPKKTGGAPTMSDLKTAVQAEPKDVSSHPLDKKTDGEETENTKHIPASTNFNWDDGFAKKGDQPAYSKPPAPAVPSTEPTRTPTHLENKIDELTESINKLVNVRFGETKKEDAPSKEMQELLKRLEKAEKENEENKRLLKSMQGQKPLDQIFGSQGNLTGAKPEGSNENKIQIEKQRKVEIDHTEPKEQPASGNVKISALTNNVVPIEKQEVKEVAPQPLTVSSAVSKDTLDSIVETRNKPTPSIGEQIASTTSTKKTLSLDELISKGDKKIEDAMPKTATLVFPGINDEKKVDIKNLEQKSALRQTLLDDLDFLKKQTAKPTEQAPVAPTDAEVQKAQNMTPIAGQDFDPSTLAEPQEEKEEDAPATTTSTVNVTTDYSSTNPFKEELLPKTKEERMKALQDKIKALNKGVTVGGNTNISSSGLDPYRL